MDLSVTGYCIIMHYIAYYSEINENIRYLNEQKGGKSDVRGGYYWTHDTDGQSRMPVPTTINLYRNDDEICQTFFSGFLKIF